MKQQDFFSKNKAHRPNQRRHGGSLLKGKRKSRRPLHSGKSLHIVSKACPNSPSLKDPRTREILHRYAARYGILIQDLAILDDHYHLNVKFTRAELLHDFLRVVNGLIARTLLSARKGLARGRFWIERVFTRVIESKSDWKNVMAYFVRNKIQAKFGMEARLAYEYDLREFEFQYGAGR